MLALPTVIPKVGGDTIELIPPSCWMVQSLTNGNLATHSPYVPRDRTTDSITLEPHRAEFVAFFYHTVVAVLHIAM
jgi:hypothetical protein